ncbi:mannose-1-phosphate guanylyltransferase/mannose-6-phosphate isomerase [Syntrophotalea sp.]|uniref:mannose-1-phosphate guanylyltransferase/mannose-6-phosphate isomerase n=1 Tax=Syntrophotalea sp. TaxID=2812029 RepID=UPI003D1279C9
MIVPVILSGGAGTRLWPLSRELYPKQLLPLVGDHTMLQETALRLEGVRDLAAPLVVCNEAHRFMVAEQLRQVGCPASTIILEPVGRNTAPAVAVAALRAMAEGDDPLLLVLPADHVIERPEALRQAVGLGAPAAEEGGLLTFGIVPTAPETGYGYIKGGPLSVVRGPLQEEPDGTNRPPTVDRSSTTDNGQRTADRFDNGQRTTDKEHIKGGPWSVVRGPLQEEPDETNRPPTAGRGSTTDNGQRTADWFDNGQRTTDRFDNGQRTTDRFDNGPILSVSRFVEKPDRATAEQYLAAGDYYWNSGMFLFKASSYLRELEKFAPQMVACCRDALDRAQRDLDFTRLDAEAFAACPSDSIDYAVMEKTADAAVIPLDAGWNDVGSWSALWEVGERDENGNVTRGDVLTQNSRNCYLHAEQRLVAAVGLENHVVVETADAVLVAPRDQVQDVKAIVQQLKARGRDEALLHRRVNRPWGAYEGLASDARFQVKRITVAPEASLSLQLHHHRAEHWIVVKGTARVTRGEETFLLSENESTYIPLGVPHRLENPGKIALEMIEVQSGSYLGEDDIVRFEDRYGR